MHNVWLKKVIVKPSSINKRYRRHFQIFSCTLKSTTGNCLKYLPKSNMVKINLLLNNQVNLLCEHNVFVLNNDENLAIFSNNMHNLCRLNYFFKSWVLNFQSCFFLSGMNARSLSIVLSFSTWESVENPWKLGGKCNFTKSILKIFLYAHYCGLIIKINLKLKLFFSSFTKSYLQFYYVVFEAWFWDDETKTEISFQIKRKYSQNLLHSLILIN